MLRDSERRLSRYHVFILSLWEEGGDYLGDSAQWRFSLENARGAERKGFKDLAELTAYLGGWTQDVPADITGDLSKIAEGENTMPMPTNRASSTPVALMPGAGEAHSIRDMTVTFKTTGRQSGGQFAVLEVTEPPGSGSPTQWHKLTTMIIYVLEGTLTLRLGDETIQAGPGGYTYIPPGTVYTIANQSHASVRYLSVHSPAWIENYIAEAIEMVNNEPSWPPADMSKFLAVRAKYDTFDPPVS